MDIRENQKVVFLPVKPEYARRTLEEIQQHWGNPSQRFYGIFSGSRDWRGDSDRKRAIVDRRGFSCESGMAFPDSAEFSLYGYEDHPQVAKDAVAGCELCIYYKLMSYFYIKNNLIKYAGSPQMEE